MAFLVNTVVSFPMAKIANLGLRGSTLIAKFMLLFVLAYYLEPIDVALYGLISVTIFYGLYFLGFDFYTYSTREILGSSHQHWARLLRDQAVFFGLTYCIVLPFFLLLFLLDYCLGPWRHGFLFWSYLNTSVKK